MTPVTLIRRFPARSHATRRRQRRHASLREWQRVFETYPIHFTPAELDIIALADLELEAAEQACFTGPHVNRVYAAVRCGHRHSDEIAAFTGLPLPQVSSYLSYLAARSAIHEFAQLHPPRGGRPIRLYEVAK